MSEIAQSNRTILRVDASMRKQGSVSRELTDRLVAALGGGSDNTIVRDLADNPPAFVDEAWIGANFTAPEDRTAEQKQHLAASDALVAELQAADTIVIGVPVYNFGIPAALKAWVDQVARARLTFRYTENGPVGLLEGKKAYLVYASGGTAVGSDIDFATGYLRHVLGFIGIHDVEVIAADRLMADATRRDAALAAIEAVVDLRKAA